MFFLKRDVYLTKICCRLYGNARKNHYDILNLPRNCTDKDIKQAFIQLSKEYHPDKNKDVRAQEKFVNIVEAYNVLSKPSSRARYDSMNHTEMHNPYYQTYARPYTAYSNASYNYNYYYGSQSKTESSSNQNTNAFYKKFGTMKLPNYVIISFCTGLTLLGILLQVFYYRKVYVNQRQQSLEKSKRLAEELERVRAAALANGNEKQTRLLLDKIVSAANPTVATASLGQALANEKKNAEAFLMELGVPEEDKDWACMTEKNDTNVDVYKLIQRIMSFLCSY